MKAAVVLILKRRVFFCVYCEGGGDEGQEKGFTNSPAFPPCPPSDVRSCPQGYPPTTPGSTTSTPGMLPGTLPIPSLSSAAAQSAGMSQAWGPAPQKPRRTHTQSFIKAESLEWVNVD